MKREHVHTTDKLSKFFSRPIAGRNLDTVSGNKIWITLVGDWIGLSDSVANPYTIYSTSTWPGLCNGLTNGLAGKPRNVP